MKTLILSALVYPGAGQFYLKKNISGCFFAGCASISLYYLLAEVLQRLELLKEKLNRGEIDMNVSAMTELMLAKPVGESALILEYATIALAMIWFVSSLDAYRIGRAEDRRLSPHVHE